MRIELTTDVAKARKHHSRKIETYIAMYIADITVDVTTITDQLLYTGSVQLDFINGCLQRATHDFSPLGVTITEITQ